MLIISKNDIFYKEWSSELKKSVISRINPGDSLITHLWNPVKLANDVTLKRIIEIASCNYQYWENVLLKPIRSIISNSKQKITKESSVPSINGSSLHSLKGNESELSFNVSTSSIQYLEIGWDVEKYENEISFDTYFSGINLNTNVHYSLDLSQVNKLINYRIRLNPNVIMYYTDESIGKEVNLGYRNFLLINIMKAIFYELETSASIEKNNNELIKIGEMIDNLKEKKNEKN